MSKYKTILTAKAELVSHQDDGFKALASRVEDKYGIELQPQIDLLYVRSCLVTAGETKGINDNDDIFTREEAWAARHTPLIKPANWQHQDKDIVGVVFSVEARDLDGNMLDFNSDEVPECEFEFWTEAAVFRLIHPERSREIEARASAGNLYVSMEAWFDDYSYGILDESGRLDQTVARNDETAFLDNHLRSRGGSGTYESRRIGRALKNITYGGFGFVDVPANKRSIISDVGNVATSREDRVLSLLKEAMDRLETAETKKEEPLMTANASADGDAVKRQVREAIQEREAEAAKAAQEKALADRAEAAEARVQELEQQVSELEGALDENKAKREALEAQMGELDTVIETLSAEGGATGSTPAEIAAIDGTSSGEDAFRAKIAWIGNSVASLKEEAAEASILKSQLAEAAKTIRADEVTALFTNAGVEDEEVVQAYVDHALNLSDEEFDAWKAQSEVLILAIQGAKKEMPEEMMKKGKEKKKEDSSCAENVFVRLAESLRSEGGETPMINPPRDKTADVKSGVTPSAPGLKTPRHKIAGSASEDTDPTSQLDDVQEEDGVNLAGASQAASEEKDPREAFRSLAHSLVHGTATKSEEKRPSFDPVE